MATNASQSNTSKKTKKDFQFIKEIGCGSYSTVFLVIEKATDRELALKAVSKDLIRRLKKVPEVFREKAILARLADCSYAVKLQCTFQDNETLYFGLTYCSNGDLLQYIIDAGHFHLDIVRFYSAELIEALEQLHIRHIIHRDLKPENILLTDDMHIQLTDFGSAVMTDTDEVSKTSDNDGNNEEKKLSDRRNSFVGTPQFVAPEILQGGSVHNGSDFWSLGCIIYQMMTGQHLFRGNHQYDIMNAVVRVSYKLPDDLPEMITDLVQKLMRLEPRERLGSEEAGGIEKLKAHSLFSEVEWGNLLNRRSPLEAKAKLNSRPTTRDNKEDAEESED